MASESVDDPGIPAEGPRRTFLSAALGTAFLGWIGTVLFPVFKYLSPLQESSSANEVELGEKGKKDIEAAGFTILALGAERVLVFQDAKGSVRATSAKCTHEGCTVQYKKDESVIWCACHNGRFDIDGRVLSGPPPRPLVAFKASGTLKTKIVVSRGEA